MCAASSTLSAADAALAVLRDAGTPLHIHEIVQRVLDGGLWRTSGKTPGATIEAQITVDIKKHGAGARFRRVAPRVFAINEVTLLPPDPAPPTEPVIASTSASTAALPAADTTPAPPLAEPTLSFTDAAERVLLESRDRQPLHYQEITRRALDRRLITTTGRTPAATMYSVIIQEIDRQLKRGETPRFVRHGRGLVGLTTWVPEDAGLRILIERHNRATRAAVREQLHDLAPEAFEALVGRLLVALGFESVEVTQRSGDGGIDVRGVLVVGDVVRIRMAVQAKRWKRNIQAPTVQQVRGSLGAHEQGLIITTSDFSSGARTEAARRDASPVALMHGEQLVALLMEHTIGVRRTRHDLFEVGGEDEALELEQPDDTG